MQSEGVQDYEPEEGADAPEASSSGSGYPPSIQAGIPSLGELPQGWRCYQLGELVIPIERPAVLVEGQVYQLVKARRNRGGIIAREQLRADQIKTKTQFTVRSGDFLISNRQISHGGCGMVPGELDGALVSNEYTALKVTSALDPGFLRALSHSIYFQQTCFHSSVGVQVEKLVFRLQDWQKWPFNIPPIEEQRRISEVLEIWEKTIDKTERLIVAKQRQWKQTIRQLESKDWKPVALEKLGRWIGGGTPSTSIAEYWTNGTIPWVSPKDMGEWIVDGAQDWISPSAVKASTTNIAPAGSVLVVTRSGILRSKVPVAVAMRDVAINQDIKALILDPSLGRLCAALLVGNNERLRRETTKIGTTVESIDLDALKSFELPLPETKDAVDTAECLIVGGLVELDLLSGKLDAYRAQKHGLLQKLLTGQCRLRRDAA